MQHIQHTYVPFDQHPVQLWVGSQDAVVACVEYMVQKLFCFNNGCNVCIECHKIRTHQHHALMWITPERGYTRELIEPILHVITLQRAKDEPFFFVLQNADFLSENCANALLKSIEEPPLGYHFILIAERKQMVLPTIRSRCLLYTIDQKESTSQHQSLFDHFTKQRLLTGHQFLQTLETTEINERESIELLDALLAHWRMKLHTALKEDGISNKKIMNILNILIKATQKPPMPGSSKLFWKNLFLQL